MSDGGQIHWVVEHSTSQLSLRCADSASHLGLRDVSHFAQLGDLRAEQREVALRLRSDSRGHSCGHVLLSGPPSMAIALFTSVPNPTRPRRPRDRAADARQDDRRQSRFTSRLPRPCACDDAELGSGLVHAAPWPSRPSRATRPELAQYLAKLREPRQARMRCSSLASGQPGQVELMDFAAGPSGITLSKGGEESAGDIETPGNNRRSRDCTSFVRFWLGRGRCS